VSEVSRNSVLVIAETRVLLQSLEAAIRAKNPVQITGVLWGQTPTILKPEFIRDSSLVVVELFRRYECGERAEGVVLAERWMGVTPFLIVAPRCSSDHINCLGYWDMASPDSLAERVHMLLANPEEGMDNFDRLKMHVRRHLGVPKQH
jgi:hypothetical protein